MQPRCKNKFIQFHIGISEVEVDKFYIEIDPTDIEDFHTIEEEVSRLPHFRGITRTPDGHVLFGFQEYFEGSIQNFIDGKYSCIYPDKGSEEANIQFLSDFIVFPEAVSVMTKSSLKHEGVVYDAKASLEKKLDVILSDDAELDSPPNLELEIYDGHLTVL